jgi:hypothetical protein
MESTQAKPARKRRRWLILTFVLWLVSGIAWWYWPRGDSRFVGKWRIPGSRVSDKNVLELLPNGTARIRWSFDSSIETVYWTASEDTVVLGWPSTDRRIVEWSLPLCQFVDSWLALKLTQRIRRDQIRILSISADVITLEGRRWTRIPERL